MPNFLVIGANKAGTSSIYQYLDQHSQVYMSPVKEPMFFSLVGGQLNGNWRDRDESFKWAAGTLEEYQALFRGVAGEKAIGEASTSYLHCPTSADCIRHYIPDVRLIAILRDCAERAYSNYLMYVERGWEKLAFAQAIREEENRIRSGYPMGWHYVKLGFYYEPLKHFFEVFERSQIQVYLYNDLKADPVGLMQDIFRFLGVDTSFVPDTSARYNVSGIPKNRLLHHLLAKPNPIATLLGPFLSPRLKRIINAVRNRNLVRPAALPLEVRKELIELYRPDILKLENLIQRDLAKWLE